MPRRLPEFNSFLGQRRVVNTLIELADTARERGNALPPLMLIGAAGLGKTSLARALGRHLAEGRDDDNSNMHMIYAGPNCTLELHSALTAANAGDVVFVDEVHALGPRDAEVIHLAVDDQQTLGRGDTGRLNRSTREPIAAVNLVMATNLPGKVPKALMSRGVRLELEPYTQRELKEIAQRIAASNDVDLTAQAAGVVADYSSGTPRSVEQLVTLLTSLSCPARVTKAHVQRTLDRCLGLGEDGLTPNQRRLLQSLSSAGGSSRAGQVVAGIGLDPQFIRDDIEEPLVRRGLITIDANHRRSLTTNGRKVCESLQSDVAEANEDESSGNENADDGSDLQG